MGGGLESGGPLLLLFEDGIVAKALSLRLLAVVARGMCLVALDMEQAVARQHFIRRRQRGQRCTEERVARRQKQIAKQSDATRWGMVKRDAMEWRCCCE